LFNAAWNVWKKRDVVPQFQRLVTGGTEGEGLRQRRDRRHEALLAVFLLQDDFLPGWYSSLLNRGPKALCSQISRNAGYRQLAAIAQPLQVGFDGFLQLRGLGELGMQFSHEPRHLFRERLAVVCHFLRPHIPARREDVAVRGNLGEQATVADLQKPATWAYFSAPLRR